MAVEWTAEETSALGSVWGHAEVQSKLDGVTRNRTVFKKISNELGEMGFSKTWQQCHTKAKNLTQRYRKVSTWRVISTHSLFLKAGTCLSTLSMLVTACCHCYMCFQVKDSNRVSGNRRITFPFYDELDTILRTCAASPPTILLESSGTSSSATTGLTSGISGVNG